ncbi:MAG: hypothetical protein NXI08_08495 [bacterium]|nr:hypothetical protein [bacterium]
MKIFIGPREIAGFYKNLSSGFSKLGLTNEFFEIHPHKFSYDGGKSNTINLKIYRYLLGVTQSKTFEKHTIIKGILLKLAFVPLIIWAAKCFFSFDVFIFSYGDSLLPKNYDLRWYKRCGKKVIAILGHGSEIRPPYADGSLYDTNLGGFSTTQIYNRTQDNRQTVTNFEKYADYIIAAPFNSQFLSKPFINWAEIGIPFEVEKINIQSMPKDNSNQKLRFLHAPSNTYVKGTKVIRNSIDEIRKAGYQLEYVEIKGQPFATVLKEIEKSDVIIDQVYSDVFLAGLATEAASKGKPSITGGQRLDYLRRFVSNDMIPPFIETTPESLTETLKAIIEGKIDHAKVGIQANKYLAKEVRPEKVAKKIYDLILDKPDKNWFLDPYSITYVHGVGQRPEVTKENIRNLVDKFGDDALGLNHNLKLKNAFLEFARS